MLLFDQENQVKLKAALQEEKDSAKLECLSAALISRLLGVAVAVAKSGFQHGADAGPSGRQGRRFRIECKKYGDDTILSDRELQGEVDDALRRDPALEAWILVATREVSEQTEQVLCLKGETVGVPIVILDWKSGVLGDFAALCAFAPDLVADIFSSKAGGFANALQPVCGETIDRIKRDLQAWCLGFDELRKHSLAKLQNIWDSPRTSSAALGQDAAGGACANRIRRQKVYNALEHWWTEETKNDAPIAVVGFDGVGKTWATLDWLVDRQEALPIVLVVPSSAAPDVRGASETALKLFLADQLYELAGVRDRDHWLRRLDNLLKRPLEEGPVLTVFLDGLNQEPSIPWLSLLKIFQGPIFSGRVRVIISTRTLHYETKLNMLSGLILPAVVVPVGVYDLEAGGELDQMLTFEGFTREDLHPDLIPLARTPRLFRLVLRFRERLIEAGKVTVHRLLWEYGRDSFGIRAGRSFSEDEWREWLGEIASRHRNGIQQYSLKSLSETASRPDLTEGEVYARLSDIVDGRFVTRSTGTDYQLTSTVVDHALGSALLIELDAVTPPTFDSINSELALWLDPISDLDQRAEILRAAVSIFVERGGTQGSKIGGVLVTAWLQTQNVTDVHRRELRGLATNLPDALLDAVEQSSDRTHASARLWAVNALRAIDRGDASALSVIVNRARIWYSVVSRGLYAPQHRNADIEKSRSQRLIDRVGVDASGPLRVVGIQLTFVDRDFGGPASAVASILEGFPLASVVPAFEAAAVSQAVAGRLESWDSLKWLCLLNEVDQEETASALRVTADAILTRTPEPGINPSLPARAASLLLWLTGQERDETTAVQLDPGLDRWLTYNKDYLPQPGRSFFPLERRHAQEVLNDMSLSPLYRGERCGELWLDPTFKASLNYIAEIRGVAPKIDVEKLNRHCSLTIEDHNFEKFESIFARCARDLLADLTRRKVDSYRTCPANSRYWRAIHATDHLLLIGKNEADAVRALRLGSREQEEGNELYATSQLLFLELQDLDALQQVEIIIDSGLKDILQDFEEILKPLTSGEADELVTRFNTGTALQQRILLILLSQYSIHFGDVALKWLNEVAFGVDVQLQGFAYQALTKSDASQFGRNLFIRDWSWSSDKDYWVNHYGSGALIEGSMSVPFDQVAPRLAPWRLLEASRKRGSVSSEVRLAATIFGQVLAGKLIEVPDLGSPISVDRSEGDLGPVVISVISEPSDEHTDDPFSAIKAALDFGARLKAHRRAVDIARARINDARRSGASLYLTNVAAEDLKPVLVHAPDMIEAWIEGFGESNNDFSRRVCLAESVYLALCEVLLAHDPSRGVILWRSTRRALKTRFVGDADIDELVHIVFRAPDSTETAELCDELVGLDRCHTDQELLNVAIAAEYNDKSEWLSSVIERDKASSLAWRRKRGLVLEGFRSHANLPVPEAWPDGEVKTSHDNLRRWSARFRYRAACAHHWWRTYLAVENLEEAYAAWVLFLHSADRRAWVWIKDEAVAANDGSALYKRKINHANLNQSKIRRAMDDQEKELNKSFLNRKTVEGLSPWSGLGT